MRPVRHGRGFTGILPWDAGIDCFQPARGLVGAGCPASDREMDGPGYHSVQIGPRIFNRNSPGTRDRHAVSKRLIIAIVATVATLAIVIMLGLFHRRLTPQEYDTIQMCAFSEEARRRIEAAALSNRTVEGSGRWFEGPVEMRSRHQEYRLDVTADGVIEVQSRGTGVSLRLSPLLRQGRVRWETGASPEELSPFCRP